jgi:hypothetical protein
MKEAYYLRDKLKEEGLTVAQRDKLIARENKNKYERRYTWVLMKKSMSMYHNTSKYKRLLKLRSIWSDKGKVPIYKEDIPLNGALINPGNKILNVNTIYYNEK